jgi:large subunit ribosomal protein L31
LGERPAGLGLERRGKEKMKKGIHPEFYTDAQVICACGNTFITGATKKVIRTDVCSACHPFFTGEQRIVDTGGQVERFQKRLKKTEELARKEG